MRKRAALYRLAAVGTPSVSSVDVSVATSADDPSIVALFTTIHTASGGAYPPVSPHEIGTWLMGRDWYARYVARSDGGAVIGHVGVADAARDTSAPTWERHLGVARSELGVLARLAVAPTERGRGLGRLLLRQAMAETRRRGLIPVLDVFAGSEAAIELYLSEGFALLEMTSFQGRPTAVFAASH